MRDKWTRHNAMLNISLLSLKLTLVKIFMTLPIKILKLKYTVKVQMSISGPLEVLLFSQFVHSEISVQYSSLIKNPLIRNFLLKRTDFHSPIFTKELVHYWFINNSGYKEQICIIFRNKWVWKPKCVIWANKVYKLFSSSRQHVVNWLPNSLTLGSEKQKVFEVQIKSNMYMFK